MASQAEISQAIPSRTDDSLIEQLEVILLSRPSTRDSLFVRNALMHRYAFGLSPLDFLEALISCLCESNAALLERLQKMARESRSWYERSPAFAIDRQISLDKNASQPKTAEPSDWAEIGHAFVEPGCCEGTLSISIAKEPTAEISMQTAEPPARAARPFCARCQLASDEVFAASDGRQVCSFCLAEIDQRATEAPAQPE